MFCLGYSTMHRGKGPKALDKKGILIINVSYFSMKTYFVGTH